MTSIEKVMTIKTYIYIKVIKMKKQNKTNGNVFFFTPQVSLSVWCRCTSVRSPPRTCEASWASFPAFTFVLESLSHKSWDSMNCLERYCLWTDAVPASVTRFILNLSSYCWHSSDFWHTVNESHSGSSLSFHLSSVCFFFFWFCIRNTHQMLGYPSQTWAWNYFKYTINTSLLSSMMKYVNTLLCYN